MKTLGLAIVALLAGACGPDEYASRSATGIPVADCALNDVRCVDGVFEVCAQPHPEDVRAWVPALDCAAAGMSCRPTRDITVPPCFVAP